jgi:dTDP-4-dehydrorhamnose 3,5-epimerase
MDLLNLIKVYQLSRIPLDGGDILKIYKKSDNDFLFKEIYFTNIDYNFVKGWKMHKLMTMNLIVPVGEVEFYFVSSDFKSKKNIVIGKSNYSRLQVPPNIWFSFKGLDSNTNLVCNLASIEHEPNEVSRIKLGDFPITL